MPCEHKAAFVTLNVDYRLPPISTYSRPMEALSECVLTLKVHVIPGITTVFSIPITAVLSENLKLPSHLSSGSRR